MRQAYQEDKSRTVMVYADMKHQAKSWEVERRIVIKAQRTVIGPDTRFLVTNSKLTPKGIYEEYSQRGQALGMLVRPAGQMAPRLSNPPVRRRLSAATRARTEG